MNRIMRDELIEFVLDVARHSETATAGHLAYIIDYTAALRRICQRQDNANSYDYGYDTEAKERDQKRRESLERRLIKLAENMGAEMIINDGTPNLIVALHFHNETSDWVIPVPFPHR